MTFGLASASKGLDANTSDVVLMLAAQYQGWMDAGRSTVTLSNQFKGLECLPFEMHGKEETWTLCYIRPRYVFSGLGQFERLLT